jgi:lipopolysaccharide exporter
VTANRLVNLKGDLFASTFSFAAQALIRLVSNLILTRLLNPNAYGIITIIISISLVVEMIGDLAVTVSIVRHENGERPEYLNTAWTLQFARSALNTAVVFIFAPNIVALYHAPSLALPLRVFSFAFVLSGIRSMSFPVAVRRKRSQVVVYSELVGTLGSTCLSLAYCAYFRDFWGLVYGMLANRAITTALSFYFYPEIRPHFQYDRAAARDLFGYTKFAMPSTVITLGLGQFDKIIFLRLFTLPLLGVYGLAAGIAGSVEALVLKISEYVLYPRYAHEMRTLSRSEVAFASYKNNAKPLAAMLFVPAAIGGAAPALIHILYDSRYQAAGFILQAFMLRNGMLAFTAAAEDLLIATGDSHIILVANLLRGAWMGAATFLGYYFFGFTGFVYGVSLTNLPALVYYLRLQHTKKLLVLRYEMYKLVFACTIALAFYALGLLASALVPGHAFDRKSW